MLREHHICNSCAHRGQWGTREAAEARGRAGGGSGGDLGGAPCQACPGRGGRRWRVLLPGATGWPASRCPTTMPAFCDAHEKVGSSLEAPEPSCPRLGEQGTCRVSGWGTKANRGHSRVASPCRGCAAWALPWAASGRITACFPTPGDPPSQGPRLRPREHLARPLAFCKTAGSAKTCKERDGSRGKWGKRLKPGEPTVQAVSPGRSTQETPADVLTPPALPCGQSQEDPRFPHSLGSRRGGTGPSSHTLKFLFLTRAGRCSSSYKAVQFFSGDQDVALAQGGMPVPGGTATASQGGRGRTHHQWGRRLREGKVGGTRGRLHCPGHGQGGGMRGGLAEALPRDWTGPPGEGDNLQEPKRPHKRAATAKSLMSNCFITS